MKFKLLATSTALILAFGAAQTAMAAQTETRMKISADKIRVVNTKTGEAANAEGNVKIEVPGQVRITAPLVRLLKGPDGKVARAVFPGSVRIEDLNPNKQGEWKTEYNSGGYYDFKTSSFTELNPKGVYEFEVRDKAPAPQKG